MTTVCKLNVAAHEYEEMLNTGYLEQWPPTGALYLRGPQQSQVRPPGERMLERLSMYKMCKLKEKILNFAIFNTKIKLMLSLVCV